MYLLQVPYNRFLSFEMGMSLNTLILYPGGRAGRQEGSEFESRYIQEFSPFHLVQSGSGTQQALYPVGTVGNPAGP
jgi:hypothetical protein